MPTDLLITKLTVPCAPPSAVARPRLEARLRAGLGSRLVLVAAPAGSGKSTLLSMWLGRLGRPAGWLSLDPGDNDLGRFLMYLVRALQGVNPAFGAGLIDELRAQVSVKAEPVLVRLINDVAGSGEPFVLVLDDFHVLSRREVHDAAEFLLEHLPPQVCLVVASRSDPPLALARLRARGQLLELRADDLRFSPEEAEALLNGAAGLGLSGAAVASLGGRTEGWAAGLQLAALSLAGRRDKEGFVRAFAGSHHHLADYLMSEVLAKQSEEVRAFLRRTSVLGRFTAPLCEAVSGQADSRATLEHLLAANLFLIPLDETRTWFRYHHLFAEFLRHRLQAEEGGRLPELHGRASRWFEREGLTDEAVGHAMQAGDPPRAAALIEGVAFDLTVYWNNAQLVRYVQRLPAALLAARPRLCIYYVWALTNTGQLGDLAAALPLLERSEAHAAQPHTVRACVLTMRAYARLRGLDFGGADRLCRAALGELGTPEVPSDEERTMLVAATNLQAYGALYSDLERAERLYPAARGLSERLGLLVGVVNGFARLGRVQHQLGRLHKAHRTLSQGLAAPARWRAQEGHRGRVVNVGELHLNLARLFYEWNRLADADAQLAEARELNRAAQFPPTGALECKTAFLLERARGRLSAAAACLDGLDRLSLGIPAENRLHRQVFEVTAMELRLLLSAEFAWPAEGRARLLREVAAWLGEADPNASGAGYAAEGPAYVRALYLVQTAPGEALPLLARLVRQAEQEGRLDDLIRYLVLRALAAPPGSADLGRALALAEPEGYCRLFLDHGGPLYARLADLARRRPTPYLERLLAAFAPGERGLGRRESPSGVALSDRQLEVLRLLALGRSNKEIARGLELSLNTVKWYLRTLYEALEVNTRVKAVNRAKELGLGGDRPPPL